MAHDACSTGELSDKFCAFADAPTSFRCDVCKRFGFPFPGNVKEKSKQTDKKYVDTAGLIHIKFNIHTHTQVQFLVLLMPTALFS